MKTFSKIFISILLFITICNIPVISGFLEFFVGGNVKGDGFGFVTRDLHFFAGGELKRIEIEGFANAYKAAYPELDHNLYRVWPTKKIWRVWKYREYLMYPEWRAPFLVLPENFQAGSYSVKQFKRIPQFTWDEQTKRWVPNPAWSYHGE